MNKKQIEKLIREECKKNGMTLRVDSTKYIKDQRCFAIFARYTNEKLSCDGSLNFFRDMYYDGAIPLLNQ